MIKGLVPRLAEAGKIKIGGLGPERKSKQGNAFRPPLKFDHFLITGTQRNDAGDLAVDEALTAALIGAGYADADGKIRELPIVLHSDNIDEVFPTSYALYSGKRCACRGDGEKALKREVKNKEFTGVEGPVDCPCEYLGAETGPVCKPNGKLFCSVAAPNSAMAGAVHIWRTTSIISIQQMIASLLQIKAICGTLRGIPLTLTVRPVTVEPKNSAPITVYTVHVELRAADIEAVQRRAIEAAKLRAQLGCDDQAYRRMLTLPAHGESLEEQAAIGAEFYAEDVTNTGADAAPKRTTREKGTSASDVAEALKQRAAADAGKQAAQDGRQATNPPGPDDPGADSVAGTDDDGRPI